MPSPVIPPDQVLIETYSRARIFSDRLATESKSRERFFDLLPPANQDSDPDQIIGRILTLRKNGKLPRLSK